MALALRQLGRVALLLLWVLGSVAAWAAPPQKAARTRAKNELVNLADSYFWEWQTRQLRPVLSEAGNRAWERKVEDYQSWLDNVRYTALGEHERITYRMFKRELKMQQRYLKEGWIAEDINGSESLMHTIISAIDVVDGKTVSDWKWMIKSIERSPKFMKDYANLLRKGLETEKVRPKEAIQSAIKTLGVLSSQDARKNPFLKLEQRLDTQLEGNPRRAELKRKLRKAVNQTVADHAELRAFLRKEYLPKASKLGSDPATYDYYLDVHLGKDHPSANSIHNWGQREVERLHRQLEETVLQVNPKAKGWRSAMHGINRRKDSRYRNGEQLMQEASAEVFRALDLARKHLPIMKSTVKVRPVASHQEDTLAAQYMVGFGMEGTFEVNTGKLLKGQRRYDMATLVTHEVYAGHHLAAMYANKKLKSDYRSGAAHTAYDEGWALYAEQLRDNAKDFTPYERIGFLVNHLWRAARLAVGTGLHTGKMTRKQAIDYFQRATFTARDNATAEIDRYINWPGQALAYYVGKREFLRARRDAERILGKKFDAKAFHARVLSLGSVPTSEMREAVVKWANRREAQVGTHKAQRPGTRRKARARTRHRHQEGTPWSDRVARRKVVRSLQRACPMHHRHR